MTLYNTDGTLTDSALEDIVRWTERRGLNILQLAEALQVDPKPLGIAIQRAKANGSYKAKYEELVQMGVLKKNRPAPPERVAQTETPKLVFDFRPGRSEHKSAPQTKPIPDPESDTESEPMKEPLTKSAAAIPSKPRGMTKSEYAQQLLASGLSPEDAARTAGYASVKRMEAAFQMARTSPTSQGKENVDPAQELDTAKQTAEECTPDEDATPTTEHSEPAHLKPAYVGRYHVYVPAAEGLEIIETITGYSPRLPWEELEEILAIQRKKVLS